MICLYEAYGQSQLVQELFDKVSYPACPSHNLVWTSLCGPYCTIVSILIVLTQEFSIHVGDIDVEQYRGQDKTLPRGRPSSVIFQVL